MRIEIVQTNAQQPWHARLVGDNGEKVWTTEKYAKRSGALNAVTFLAEGLGVKGSIVGPPNGAQLTYTVVGSIDSSTYAIPVHDVDERTS